MRDKIIIAFSITLIAVIYYIISDRSIINNIIMNVCFGISVVILIRVGEKRRK